MLYYKEEAPNGGKERKKGDRRVQDILKNTNAYTRLLSQRETGNLSHAYLLVYDDPVHTKTALKALAKILFYAEENTCGEYDSPNE